MEKIFKKSIFWTGESDIDRFQQRARSLNRERQELKANHKPRSWAYQKFNYQGISRASGLHSGLLTGSWYSFKSWTRAQLKSHSSEFSFFTKQVCFDKQCFSALRPTCGFFKGALYTCPLEVCTVLCKQVIDQNLILTSNRSPPKRDFHL